MLHCDQYYHHILSYFLLHSNTFLNCSFILSSEVISLQLKLFQVQTSKLISLYFLSLSLLRKMKNVIVLFSRSSSWIFLRHWSTSLSDCSFLNNVEWIFRGSDRISMAAYLSVRFKKNCIHPSRLISCEIMFHARVWISYFVTAMTYILYYILVSEFTYCCIFQNLPCFLKRTP